jgi:hypothetical protein
MTTLERPLPLNVVAAALVLCCAGGFAMGLLNTMKVDHGGAETSKAPLAAVSGVPVKDASPAVAYEPPPVEKPKPKPVEVEATEQDAPPPAIETPPATTAATQPAAPAAPKTAEPQAPKPVEDLY